MSSRGTANGTPDQQVIPATTQEPFSSCLACSLDEQEGVTHRTIVMLHELHYAQSENRGRTPSVIPAQSFFLTAPNARDFQWRHNSSLANASTFH